MAAETDDLTKILSDERGAPLLERFLPAPRPRTGLLAVFPGKMYSADAPLFKQLIEILRPQGWDVMVASYSASGRPPSELAGEGEVLQRARLALDRLAAACNPERIGLAGKSLGTPFVADLCGQAPVLAMARAAYLTPLLGSPAFDEPFVRTHQPAYLAIGTADPFYDAQALDRLRAERPFDLTVVDSADHGMNVPGDRAASAAAVERLVAEVVKFFTS
jgi:dienelactone hydrolase